MEVKCHRISWELEDVTIHPEPAEFIPYLKGHGWKEQSDNDPRSHALEIEVMRLALSISLSTPRHEYQYNFHATPLN
jgi:hypothetical protein